MTTSPAQIVSSTMHFIEATCPQAEVTSAKDSVLLYTYGFANGQIFALKSFGASNVDLIPLEEVQLTLEEEMDLRGIRS